MIFKKNTIKKFKKAYKPLELDKTEKANFRTELFSTVKNNPVRKIDASRHILSGERETIFPNLYLILRNKPMIASIALFLALALGGGVSYAAEAAVPGDVLYPIKLHVNEEVRAAATFGDKADAEWDVRRAERRLQEVAVLVATKKLDGQTEVNLQKHFEKHTDKAQERIVKLKTKLNNSAAVHTAIRLEAVLEAYEQVLNLLSDANINTREEMKGFIKELHTELKESKELRTDTENNIKSNTSVEVEAAARGRLKALEAKIEEVANFIERSKVDSESLIKAKLQLDEAKEIMVVGQTNLEAKNYGEAFDNFGQAHRQAQSAKIMLQTGKIIELKIPSKIFMDVQQRNRQTNDDTEQIENEQKNEGNNATKDSDTSVDTQTKIESDTELDLNGNNLNANTDLDANTSVDVTL